MSDQDALIRSLRELLEQWQAAATEANRLVSLYSQGGDAAGNAHAFLKEHRIWLTCISQVSAVLDRPAPPDFGWHDGVWHQGAQPLVAESRPAPPSIGTACSSCGDVGQGGYEVEDGPGPFCETCWDLLREHFTASPAQPTCPGCGVSEMAKHALTCPVFLASRPAPAPDSGVE